VARFAASEAGVLRVLMNALHRRGWDGEGDPRAVAEAEVARLARLGILNDATFATSKAASLARRGVARPGVAAKLRGLGVGRADTDAAIEALGNAKTAAWQQALAYAKRRRLGPYGAPGADTQKALAAMMRAGHPPALARKIIGWPADDLEGLESVSADD
jgi:regulatory protein